MTTTKAFVGVRLDNGEAVKGNLEIWTKQKYPMNDLEVFHKPSRIGIETVIVNDDGAFKVDPRYILQETFHDLDAKPTYYLRDFTKEGEGC